MGKKQSLDCKRTGHDRNRYGKCWKCEARKAKKRAENAARRSQFVVELFDVVPAMQKKLDEQQARIAALENEVAVLRAR